MNAPVVTVEIAKRFRALRHQYVAARIGIVMAVTIVWLMLAWLALATGDFIWEWPATVRKSGLAAVLVITGAVVGWRCWVLGRDCGRRQFVGRLERSYTGFGQRLRTVLDTVDGRVSGPREMLAALGHQTLGRWETLMPSRVVPGRALGLWTVSALAVSLMAMGLIATGGDRRIAMLRALGASTPYTILAVVPGDMRLLEGTPVEVSLELRGRTDRDVLLRYRETNPPEGSGSAEQAATGHWTESELLPSPHTDDSIDARVAVFTAGLGVAAKPMEYQFVTSVGNTRIYHIDVQLLIDAERIEAVVQPPEYTRLEQRIFASSDISVLERSRVTVNIQTNHPLAKATLELGPKTSQLQLAADQPSGEARHWSFPLPTLAPLHWRFSGEGRDGTPMTPVAGRMRIRYDRPPMISWRDPHDEIRVHTLAELPMRVDLSDDYGMHEAGIAFQLGDEEYILADWPPEDREAAGTTRMRLEEVLPLESLGLSERDYIAYYAYAVDTRKPNPQRSESEVRYIDIRPLRQFYSESDAEPGDGVGSGVLVQLSEIIRRQRFLINQTRKLTRSSNVDLAGQLGTIDRMVEGQSELAGLTRFLAEFFVSRGNDDVEALSQAEAAMLQAADSLAAGSFDVALAQEEDALRALAEARRTLEIVLRKRLTSRDRQALLQLAQQLRQKLRRDRPENEQEIADTLQRLAGDQARLGRTAATLQRQQQPMMTGGGRDNPTSEATGNPTSETTAEPTSEATGNPTSETTAEPASEGTAEPASEGTAERSSGEPADEAGKQPGDATGTPTGAEGSGEPASRQEQRDAVYASQIDLLERLLAVEEQLADRLNSSTLMTQRMHDVKTAIDRLAEQARDGQLDEYAAGTHDAAEQLREMAVQVDALAATEPVTRVAALRDMTASLANTESQLGDRLTPSPSGSAPAQKESSLDPTEIRRLATRMRRRTETIQDVLQAPEDVGDVEMSEVNQHLERFLEEEEFLQQLATTREAASQPLDEPRVQPSAGEQARRRAVDYLEAAQRLDELYRQLVTPRLTRLRQLEQQATALASKLSAGEASEASAEAKAGAGKLQSDLQAAGLDELAEMVRAEEESGGQQTAAMLSELGAGSGIGLTTSLAGRVLLVAQELRERIQDAVLLEVSADRDAPVPVEYRTAVDRYFRTIAGRQALAEAEENQQP